VVNHGVSKQAMRDMEAVCKEFFQLPVAEKVELYSEDGSKANRLFSGTSYKIGGERYWRDCLSLSCPFPVVSDGAKVWPDRPHRLR
jgi:2'-deoxymugineic-acid 2'-dioxygenase/mugineic-acid 3-dioxygenase